MVMMPAEMVVMMMMSSVMLHLDHFALSRNRCR
jgi:hypothetical protein